MESLARELETAIVAARAAMSTAQGTGLETYLSRLVGYGEVALGEMATRSAVDLNELIAALNEGARATELILGSQKTAEVRTTGEAEPQALAEEKEAEMTVKAEVTPVAVKSQSLETVARVETKAAEIVATESVMVPNTSAGRGAVEASVMPGAWGTMMIVLLAAAVAGAVMTRRAKREAV